VIHIKALIMAGGKGTRLTPLTCDIPKPMVPILNKPVMEYTIELLKKYEIKNIAVTLAHLPNVIIDYFGEGEKWGVNLQYYIEEEPLGTGGSVKNAEDFIDETLVVISGDALTDIDLERALHYHKDKKSKATLVLKNEAYPTEYGVVITNDNGEIIRFLEKPSWGEVFSNTINTGIYILEPTVLDYYRKGDSFDFSKDLFPKLLEDAVPMYGYVTHDYWCDIGDLNSYKQTQFDMLEGKVRFNLNSVELQKGIWIQENIELENNVTIVPPAFIGKNAIIKAGTTIEGYSVIGENCTIGADSKIKKSIIWNHTTIGNKSNLRGAVLCSHVDIRNKVEIYENAVIGEGTSIADNVVVKPDIKIWPQKKIHENTVVNQNLIWGTKASKTIFGHRDISGEVNIDISPEYASRLGSAYASTIKGNPIVIVSCDDSYASITVKNSIIAGVQSTGAQVIEIDNALMPINRFAVRYHQANGGIHVRTDKANRNKVYIEFTDDKGTNIQRGKERDIENLFCRDDFKRSNGEKIKRVVEVANFSSIYINSGLKSIKALSVIKRSNLKVFVSSHSEAVMNLANEYLEELGCQPNSFYPFNRGETEEHIYRFSQLMLKERADIGVYISENGEELLLIDNKGRVISKEKYDVLAALLIFKKGIRKIVQPYIAPSIIDRIAEAYGGSVIRTKSNPSSVMNAMLPSEKDQDESMLQYHLTYNAIWALGYIIEFTVERNIALSDLIDEVPHFYFIKREIPCSWEDKGRVMREMIMSQDKKSIELYEGVKILQDKGWALILPDSERAVFNIYSEGFSQEYAEELSSQFSEKVQSLLKNQRQ